MHNPLIRYWFHTKRGLGIGVTAYNLEDAILLMKSEKLAMQFLPDFESYIEDVDISNLDQRHVIPNMGSCSNYGIWFPNLN